MRIEVVDVNYTTRAPQSESADVAKAADWKPFASLIEAEMAVGALYSKTDLEFGAPTLSMYGGDIKEVVILEHNLTVGSIRYRESA